MRSIVSQHLQHTKRFNDSARCVDRNESMVMRIIEMFFPFHFAALKSKYEAVDCIDSRHLA